MGLSMAPSPPRRLLGFLRAARAPLGHALLVVVQLVALRRLEYSQAWVVNASIDEARAPRDPLALGGLRWDPAPYVAAPALAPFRAMVAGRCGGLNAVATADCLSDLFAERFAHGRPSREFFAKGYSPAQDLAAHLGGAPGHCVTRSGLLAAGLLAAGFPARVAQFLPASGSGGHNVVEVWNGAQWVLVDPTYRLAVEGQAGSGSAAYALGAGPDARWRINNSVRAVPAVGPSRDTELYDIARNLLSGHLIYPDPWLYTRVGQPHAPAPFQGRFVVVGPPSLRLGLAQPLLQMGALLAFLALIASLVARLLRRGWREPLPATGLTGENPVTPAPAMQALPVRRERPSIPVEKLLD
jgi:hypothetical protein